MDFPTRKNLRLQGYNYNQNGIYFITFCTKNKAHILGASSVGRDDLGTPSPAIELTEIGKNVEKYISLIPKFYPDTKVDKYVVMPNHVHVMLNIGCGADGAPGSSRPTEKVPRIVTAIKRFTNRDAGTKIWQDGFYDHIVRDDMDYLTRWKYIDDNVARWSQDEYFAI